MPRWIFVVSFGLAVAYASPADLVGWEMVGGDGVNLRGEAVVGEDGRFSVSLTLPGSRGQALTPST